MYIHLLLGHTAHVTYPGTSTILIPIHCVQCILYTLCTHIQVSTKICKLSYGILKEQAISLWSLALRRLRERPWLMVSNARLVSVLLLSRVAHDHHYVINITPLTNPDFFIARVICSRHKNPNPFTLAFKDFW